MFATAVELAARIHPAHRQGCLAAELAKLRRWTLLVVDEVSYIPFVEHAARHHRRQLLCSFSGGAG